jgi:EAL domain-containing protein (putative c-di-GMP-specific phosphodiesterase class I)
MRRKRQFADLPEGTDSALNYAIMKRDMSVLDMVEQAVSRKQLLLSFQSVVTTADPSCIAFYEGLIRVLDDTGRIIPARDFMSAVESTETGRLIDCIALEKGLKLLARQPDLRLSLNMSARSIGYKPWVQTLSRRLHADPTLGERLILEITESSAMLIPELVIGFMQEFQAKGVSFALDDFGSGFTSFRYLRDFYFDIIKIDGQFIRGIATNPDNQVLTSALLSIADQFDMLTVAESVETAQDAAYLASIGIDCLQGYYFGAPTIKPPWEQETEQGLRA